MRKDVNRLKEARFFAGKSQPKLWLETGIHFSTISRIECGWVSPTNEQKRKLAKALKRRAGWLFPPALKSKKEKNLNEKPCLESRQ
jgi:transcriptional regulator with XRE-family HTH domain